MNVRYDWGDFMWDVFGYTMTICACTVAIALTYAIVREVFA